MTVRTLAISIQGMTCGECVGEVTNAIKSVRSVKRVEVNLEKQRADVLVEMGRAVEGEIMRAIASKGFLPSKARVQKDSGKVGTNSNVKAMCANCAGAVGIASCMVPMLLGAIGVASVGLTESSMSSMGGISGAPASSPLLQLVAFLSGFWGAVILVASFSLMVYGMWHGRKHRPLALGLLSAVILFIGMYAYISIALQLLGSALLAVTYTAVYSHSFASATRLN